MPTKVFHVPWQKCFSFMDLLLLSAGPALFPCAENIRQMCSEFGNVNFSIALHHGS